MNDRLLPALAAACITIGATAWAQSGDSATAQNIATECDALVKQSRMNYMSCATTCKAMAQTLSRPMPPAQSSLFLKMCTDARDKAAAAEAQSNAELAALEERQKQAREAAAAAGKAPANPTAVQGTQTPKSSGGLLTELGRETDYKFIDAVFLGNFSGIDPLSLRFTYMGYVTASDQYCGTKTPNGTREIRINRAMITKNRWGMEVDRFEYTEVMRVDLQLYDRVWSNMHTTPPGVNILNAGAYDDVLSAAKTDYMRLFNTWKCAGPEIRQFQENLHRAAEGQISLQAQRDRALPLPLVVQQSCDAYVQSPLADPSGYRLQSCGCLAKHTGQNWRTSDIQTLGKKVDATQVVLLAWSLQKPQLARECLARETRTGAAAASPGAKPAIEAPVSDDFGLVLRKDGYEFRALPGEPWCGLYTTKLELFHDRANYDIAARVRSAATTFVSDDLLALFNAECPKAKLAEISVYAYGSAELLENWTFRWAPNGDWVRRTSAGVPKQLTKRSAVIHAPRQAQKRDPYADSPALRRMTGREPASQQSEACTGAVLEAQTRALGTDYCAVTPAQVQRAAAEMSRIQKSPLCSPAYGVHTADAIQFSVDNRCKVQRDGGPTDLEARLIERLDNKTSCPPVADPAARRKFEHIKVTVQKINVKKRLAGVYPLFENEREDQVVAKQCAAAWLLENWRGN